MKRASKGYFGENIQLFPTMIVQGPVVQGKGSTHPVESHHTPTSAPSTSQPPITPTSRRTIRQESVVPQPRSPTQTHVVDEAASTSVDVRYGGAATTFTGLEVGQGSEVKKLENKVKSNQARRRAIIVVSDDEEDLEDPSKQGRNISEIDKDPTISLLAQRLQAEEREKYFEAEKARLLAELINQRKSEIERAIPEPTARSLKRDAEEELAQESSKRQKTRESSVSAEGPKDKEEELFTLKELGSTGRSLELEIILCLVKEKFNSTEPTKDKEREIWVELKRLFEPDTDDELWKLQKYIHNLNWKLYDSCGVHHMSTEKGIDIYMLIEKGYPLSRGTLTQMLVAKLLVEQDNEISRELLRKIFMKVKRPRR
ncbi:hypothetical protein Tco_1146415 [Tanacetum coccineum]